MMCLYRYSGLPVMRGDKMVGFIAEKDVLHRLFPTLEDMMSEGLGGIDFDEMMGKYKDVVNLKVKDLMINNVVTVSPDDHILKAATTYGASQIPSHTNSRSRQACWRAQPG